MTTLITGASLGIGKDLAREFAQRGHSLILVARSKNLLQALAQELTDRYHVVVRTIVLDLSHPSSAHTLFQRCKTEGWAIDVLVNNAGFGDSGPFHESDEDRVRAMIDLNVLTLTILCRKFLPEMVRKGSGRVLNVASTAAYQAGPFMSVYYATKAYVLHFTEGLAKELQGTGVTVSALCPGPTSTEFAKTAGIADKPLFKLPFFMDSAKVARIGAEAAMRGQTIAIAGWSNKLTAFASRLTPRALSRTVVAKLHR